jgi:hypothetical protein
MDRSLLCLESLGNRIVSGCRFASCHRIYGVSFQTVPQPTCASQPLVPPSYVVP